MGVLQQTITEHASPFHFLRLLRVCSVELKELDGRRMSPSRSESSIPCNQRGSEFLGKHDVSSIIGRKIVTESPNTGQEHKMRIPSNTEIQQIADRLVNTMYRDHSLQC
jgi:hypothetical protein